MRFEIVLAPEALRDAKKLDRDVWAGVRGAIERHLRHEPAKLSRSRIKRLRGLRKPQFRLRVGDVRIFYDVVGSQVHVLAIVSKSTAATWLEELGEPE